MASVLRVRRASAIAKLATCFFVFAAATSLAAEETWMMQLRVEGRTYEGRLVAKDATQLLLQERDGAFQKFAFDDVTDWKRSRDVFSAKTYRDLKGDLSQEFGRDFEVAGASQYVVVYPRGRSFWAPRFDEMYRSFFRFFELRGLRLETPEFPLVAVVFPDKPAFDEYAREHGFDLSPQVYGFYAPATNRVYLFDRSPSGEAEESWELGRRLVYHESAHQLAYNAGLHARMGVAPQWTVEGLGTYFESKAVWSRAATSAKDRVHVEQGYRFLASVESAKGGYLRDLVSGDGSFARDPLVAYAQSWALTYFLMERQAPEYLQYLRKIAEIPPGNEYAAKRRAADFEKSFGDDWRLLEANVERFVSENVR